VKDKTSDLVDTATAEISKIKDALQSHEVHEASSRIRKNTSNFFSSSFYILKVVFIASLLSFTAYGFRDIFFEIIVVANLTGLDVLLNCTQY
jgi:hypothetical protein